MTINEFLSKVENGARPRVDFKNKKFYLDRKEVEVNGDSVERPLEELEKLYLTFKRSYPSERSGYHLHDYFKALTAEEMTDAELVNGVERTYARASLEGFFLCWVLNGSLKWEDDSKWFWQSPTEPDLVILKEWVA